MKVQNNSTMTPKNSFANLLASGSLKTSHSIPKLATQSSTSSSSLRRNQYIDNQHRQNLSAINNNFPIQHISSSFSVPLLINTMNTFFQATQTMEDEIMLPSRLRDMPIDHLADDHTNNPDSWHEIYSFIREMRNQLRCIHPFADSDDQHNSTAHSTKDANDDDEEIRISKQDKPQFSSTLSLTSSDEDEHSSTSSGATSYDTIKDEVKQHYYGLFRALDHLTSIANRVTEKYRDEYIV